MAVNVEPGAKLKYWFVQGVVRTARASYPGGSLTQEKLREKSSMSVDVIGDAEAGRYIAVLSAELIAQVLGLDLADPNVGSYTEPGVRPRTASIPSERREKLIDAFSTILQTSAALATFLAQGFLGPPAYPSNGPSQRSIVEAMLEAEIKRVFERLEEARYRFEVGEHEDPGAMVALRKLARGAVQLIHGTSDLGDLMRGKSGGCGKIIELPATNATFVEIINARLDDDRAVGFAASPQWPRGLSEFSLPADTGRDYLETIRLSVDFHLLATYQVDQPLIDLDSVRNLTPEKRDRLRLLAAQNIESKKKNPAFGCPYCVVDVLVHESQANECRETIEALAKNWLGVRFVNMQDNHDRAMFENRLLFNLRDLLFDGASA